MPKRILTILEGEGLVNDATVLNLFRFAVAAVGTGGLSIGHAVGAFILIVIGETLYGVLVGWAMLRLRRGMRDPMVEMTLSLLTPYAAFWPPEMMGGSGVIAAVSAGVDVSWKGPGLISASTRLHGFFFWGLVVSLGHASLRRGHRLFLGVVGWKRLLADQGGRDVFVHISAVERSGMRGLAEGQKVSYDVEADRRSGKESATNLRSA